MTNTPGPKQPPSFTPQAEADRQARQAREAAALRANLRRRKAQVSAKSSTKPDVPDANRKT
jgi:hypothetical protein